MARTGAIQSAIPTGNSVFIKTTACVVCGKEHEFTLDNEKYVRRQYGEHIQNVFPELSAADREILISGTCDPCWDKLWANKGEK